MLYGKVRKHPELQVAIREYEGALLTFNIKSYEWLSTEVHRCCHTERMHKNFDERDIRMREMSGGKTLRVAAVKEEEPRRKREKTPKRSEGHLEPLPVLAVKGDKGGKGFRGHPENYERNYKETPKGGKGKGEGKKGVFTPRNRSTLHCYWFHHSTCNREKGTCRYKHDEKITPKEKEELLALGFAKRSTSEPLKKSTSNTVGEDAKARKRICNEFKKLGKCSKGDDCAYEHVAAAPEGNRKGRKQPDGALGAPAIAFEEKESEGSNAASCKDRSVAFPCAPAKEKVGHRCTSARSALSSKVSVIWLDSDEESETPADNVSDLNSSDDESDTSSEETTNSSYYEEDEDDDDEDDDEDDDDSSATPPLEEDEDPSEEDGNPEP